MNTNRVVSGDRLNVLGVAVNPVDMPGALTLIDRFVKENDRTNCVLAMNPEKVYAVRGNAALRNFVAHASLVIPDGIGIVLALRVLYGRRTERVPGADLMQNICAVAPQKGYRIFIYGASEEVNAGAVAVLERRYPGIAIVGRANGYVTEAEMPELAERINSSGADLLFVALGSPKQEQWMDRWLPQLKVKVCQGIGGTLDTITGHAKRAPMVWQRAGLEWLYRLFSKPSRISRQWKLPLFVFELCIAKLKGSKAMKRVVPARSRANRIKRRRRALRSPALRSPRR